MKIPNENARRRSQWCTQKRQLRALFENWFLLFVISAQVRTGGFGKTTSNFSTDRFSTPNLAETSARLRGQGVARCHSSRRERHSEIGPNSKRYGNRWHILESIKNDFHVVFGDHTAIRPVSQTTRMAACHRTVFTQSTQKLAPLSRAFYCNAALARHACAEIKRHWC